MPCTVAVQWVNNLVPFKMACEEIYIKEKLYKKHRTPMQIKLMYDNFSGTFVTDIYVYISICTQLKVSQPIPAP